MTLASLIDKQDTFEIVRDQIAAILVLDVAKQQALAGLAGKDPTLWAFDVYLERFRPWEIESDPPVVNVWYDNSTFPEGRGNVVKEQLSETIYNIDMHAKASSTDDAGGTGYISGDELASINLHRVIRLVRNIIMAAENTYLQLRGIVENRWIQSAAAFQPQQTEAHLQNLIAARMALRVRFNEFSPQATPTTLDYLSIETLRTGDGKVILRADYDLTP